MDKLFSELDLTSLNTWEPDLQDNARDLNREFAHLFGQDDMDLGKTSVVKHTVKVAHSAPFKERYRRTPPSQFEEVRKTFEGNVGLGGS